MKKYIIRLAEDGKMQLPESVQKALHALNVKLVVSDFLYFFVLGFSPFPGSGKRYPAESSLAWGARSNVLDALPWHSRRIHAA